MQEHSHDLHNTELRFHVIALRQRISSTSDVFRRTLLGESVITGVSKVLAMPQSKANSRPETLIAILRLDDGLIARSLHVETRLATYPSIRRQYGISTARGLTDQAGIQCRLPTWLPSMLGVLCCMRVEL